MSHIRLKTKYSTEGNYGATEENFLYADHNTSSDYVTFYNENGEVILVVPDTIDNNVLDAINRLYVPFKGKSMELNNGIEFMDGEDRLKCGI